MIVTDEMVEAAARALPGVASNEFAWHAKLGEARKVLEAALSKDDAPREATVRVESDGTSSNTSVWINDQDVGGTITEIAWRLGTEGFGTVTLTFDDVRLDVRPWKPVGPFSHPEFDIGYDAGFNARGGCERCRDE